jgi:hypothetical protein
VNFINMGVNTWTNEVGRELGEARSWEGVFGLSYGLSLTQDFSAGLNMKFVNSAIAPGFDGSGTGVGTTYAIDAGVLKRNLFIRRFDLGFMLQNMGPAIYYTDPENSDPIPFTLRIGTAYTPIETPIHEMTLLLDLNREVVKSYGGTSKPDPFWKAIWTDLINDPEFKDSTTIRTLERKFEEINISLGAEYWYSHFMALRSGFLFDYVGERYELTMGLGLNYGNMNFDWSYIVSPEGFIKPFLQQFNPTKTGSTGARHGQWRASFLFKL